MAFNDTEISTQDGRPIALYTFRWGETYWRYTSADRNIVRDEIVGDNPEPQEVTYLAVAISDNGMTQGGSQQNDFTITIPSNLPMVELFRGTPPSDSIFITVRRQHFGEEDAPIYWTGTVGNVQQNDAATGTIIGRVLTATFKRTGLRLAWTRGCPHILYDTSCRADKEDFKVTATITALTGNTLTVNAHGKEMGWFDGGFFEWEANADGTIDRRGIERQSGALTFVIFGSSDRLEVGMEIAMYAGCDRTPETCLAKFDNLANYGGFPFMAGKSPFDGDPVF